jgi:hypothetical protein
MPITRSGMRQQVIKNLSAVAPPGEQFIACVHTESGIHPYILIFLDSAIVDAIVAAFRKRYYITLTNSNFIVNKASRNMNAVKEIIAVVPISAAPLVTVKPSRILWGKLVFQLPGKPKPTTMYFRRFWNNDVNHMLEALQQMGAGAQPALGYGQVPGQFPGQVQGQYPGQVPQDAYGQVPQQQYGQQPYAPTQPQQGYAAPGQYQDPQQPGPYHQ